jgi:RimJ/RimL family protein N-acetyltransferase
MERIPAMTASSAIPVLTTAHLTLRGHRSDDLDASSAMWSDPQVTRFIGGRPSTREETWARLLRYVGHWSILGFGYWLVEDRKSGRFVGEVGFADFKREMEPSIEGTPEVGWALARWAHGQGWATEAVQAALSWSDRQLPGGRTVCMIAPENGPSIKLARKCGYAEFGQATYKSQPATLFARG